MQVLTVSDKIVESLYSSPGSFRNSSPEAIISCGDLPNDYLDYLVSNFNVPLFYVRGNHANFVNSEKMGKTKSVIHGTNLHLNSTQLGAFLISGIEGCLDYNSGSYQYTQFEMWLHTLRLVPAMLINRIRFGRSIDIFVTHAPPWGINDQPDPAHQGVKAFRWFIGTFKPRIHIHGHIHLYKPNIPSKQVYRKTLVVNTYGHQMLEI